ncbi:hypothetical protein ACIGBH_42065 [Streptomyces sp. NPDC085929]|uniref:hypothetical protein n=1 Tax=Streptomyces sp. NPDC085929 TaxID=3365739 RepID=UPI0037CEDF80
MLREAVLQALDGGRTPQQLLERIRRRWWTHGYARALADGELSSPVGVAVGLVRPSTDCPDPMCEDGITLHLADACPKCAQRRADRRRGRLPAQRQAGPAVQWWECAGEGCSAAGKGPRPDDGLCWQCIDRVEQAEIKRATAGLMNEVEAAQEAARLRQAIRWEHTLDDACTEDAERTRSAQEQAEAEQHAADDAEETRRLREQLIREHPELAAYAQLST